LHYITILIVKFGIVLPKMQFSHIELAFHNKVDKSTPTP